MNTNPIDHTIEAIDDLKNLDPEFLEIVDIYYEYEITDEADFPQYRAHVVIEDDGPGSSGTYCYPIAEYAREEWDLFLFDTVTNWDEETVTLRFGYEPDEE